MGSKRVRNKTVSDVSPPVQHTFQVVAASQSWEAPLPRPDDLQRYELLVPGAAARILSMAEEEGKHARETQSTALAGSLSIAKRGQWFALTVAVLGIVCGSSLIYSGHDVAGTTIGGTSLALIVAAFLRDLFKKDKS